MKLQFFVPCIPVPSRSGRILLETQKLTGPMPPDSASSDQFQGGYYSAGDIDLSAQLKEALQKIFPDLN